MTFGLDARRSSQPRAASGRLMRFTTWVKLLLDQNIYTPAPGHGSCLTRRREPVHRREPDAGWLTRLLHAPNLERHPGRRQRVPCPSSIACSGRQRARTLAGGLFNPPDAPSPRASDPQPSAAPSSMARDRSGQDRAASRERISSRVPSGCQHATFADHDLLRGTAPDPRSVDPRARPIDHFRTMVDPDGGIELERSWLHSCDDEAVGLSFFSLNTPRQLAQLDEHSAPPRSDLHRLRARTATTA